MHWGDYGWGMGFGSGGIFMILVVILVIFVIAYIAKRMYEPEVNKRGNSARGDYSVVNLSCDPREC